MKNSAILLLLLFSLQSYAAESPSASAEGILQPAKRVQLVSSKGTKDYPSLTDALANAKEGQTIILGPGVHQGPIVLDKKGLILRGEKGAIISGNRSDWRPEWTKAPEFGPYAYRSAIGFAPGTMTVNGRAMIDAKDSRGGLKIHRDGLGRNGREPLGAIYTWLKSGEVIISFGKDINPAGQVFQASESDSSAISISGADNCHVEGLIITGGNNGIMITNAKNAMVKGNLIFGTDNCVLLFHGATECKIIGNDLLWNADATNFNVDPASGLIGGDVWVAHKKYGTYDKNGVMVESAGDNNEIAGNYIYDVWNGIGNDNGVSSDQVKDYWLNQVSKNVCLYNRGLKVHHNRIDLTLDDALEPGGDLVENFWYSNVVTRAHCAARLKSIMQGPFYFFDNVILDSFDGLRLYKTSPEAVKVYIFNNYISHEAAVIYHQMESVMWNNSYLAKEIKHRGTPGFAIYNNVFVTQSPFSSQGGKNISPSYRADNNVYSCPKNPSLLLRGLDIHSLFQTSAETINPAKGDFRLKGGSPFQRHGAELNSFLPETSLKELAWLKLPAKPAPGLLGINPALTPHGPISGLWEVLNPVIPLGERNANEFSNPPVHWIKAKELELELSRYDPTKSPELHITRSALESGKSKFSITVSDANNEILWQKEYPKSKTVATIKPEIPAGEHGTLTIVLRDKNAPCWRIDTQDNRLKIVLISPKKFALRKYDSGRLVFDLWIPAGSKADFTATLTRRYRGNTAIEIIDPEGKSHKSGGTLTLKPLPTGGGYHILLGFIKKADFSIEAKGAELLISQQQEEGKLRNMWDKPQY